MTNNYQNKTPLEDLVVDAAARAERSEQVLSEILKGFVEITQEDGSLYLLPMAFELSAQNIILILLCGRLAQKLLGKLPKTQDEKMTQNEIMENLPTISEGTVKASLSRLRGIPLIDKRDGKNFVSTQHLERIKRRIDDEKKQKE